MKQDKSQRQSLSGESRSVTLERQMSLAGQALMVVIFFLPICAFTMVALDNEEVGGFAWVLGLWIMFFFIGAFLLRGRWRPRGCRLVWRESHIEFWQQGQPRKRIDLSQPHRLMILVKEFVGATTQAIPLPPRLSVEVYLSQGQASLSFSVGTRESGDEFVKSIRGLSISNPFEEDTEKIATVIEPLRAELSRLHCSIHNRHLKRSLWERLYDSVAMQSRTEFKASLFLPDMLDFLQWMDSHYPNNELLPVIEATRSQPTKSNALRSYFSG